MFSPGLVGAFGHLAAAALHRVLEPPNALFELASLAAPGAREGLTRGLEAALVRLDRGSGALEQRHVLGAAGLAGNRPQRLVPAVCDLEELGRLQRPEVGATSV